MEDQKNTLQNNSIISITGTQIQIAVLNLKLPKNFRFEPAESIKIAENSRSTPTKLFKSVFFYNFIFLV